MAKSTVEQVRAVVEPIVADAGLELYDVELTGGTVRVLVDRPGGVDLADLGAVTRSVSEALDAHDPLPGRYTLEVSSPGLERKLRTPAHFAAALGKKVRVRTVPGTEGERRVEGELTAADGDGVVLATADGQRRVAYDEVERAKTVFEWGPTPPPGAGRQKRRKGGREQVDAGCGFGVEVEEGRAVSGNFEMMEALQALAADKGIPADTLLEALANALVAAYKRMPGAAEEAYVTIDAESFEIRVYGQELDEDGNVTREWDDTPDDFGRIAAQTAKQVLMQGVREAERELKYEEYAGREGDIVTGIIQQTDSRFTLLDLGKVEALLPQAEQVPFERPDPGTRLKAYIVEVRKNPRGPQIVVSRTHPGLIKRLFELEVPEIADGIVELKAVAREPGHRTKVAVWSNDHNVDPVGACVGARGARVRMVVNELRGEKIDIVPFTEAVQDFVMRALSPAKVKEVRLDEETGTAEVIVPDYQLSLAIGKEGQNARLAARLTGWRVDIKSETQLAEEEAGYDGEEWAEGEWVTDASTGEMVWKPAEGGPAVTAEEWSHGDTTAEGAMEDSGGERVTEVGDDGSVQPRSDADPDARPDNERRPLLSATLPVEDGAPALAGDQLAEAASPDDEVETLEAGMVAQTTEATPYDDPIELEGAPMAAEEAAVLEGGAEPVAVSDEALEEDLDLLGVPDDERAFDALPVDEPVLATDDPEQALAEGGDTPTLEGPDPVDGASG